MYANSNLQFQPQTDNLIRQQVKETNPNVIVGGVTEVFVKVGDRLINIRDFTGDPSQISNFYVNIYINSDLTNPRLIAIIINHELSVHATKFAEIIRNNNLTTSQKYLRLRAQTATLHHRDIDNPDSAFNVINKEILANYFRSKDDYDRKVLLPNARTLVENALENGVTPVVAPNYSSYNLFILDLRSSNGDSFSTMMQNGQLTSNTIGPLNGINFHMVPFTNSDIH